MVNPVSISWSLLQFFWGFFAVGNELHAASGLGGFYTGQQLRAASVLWGFFLRWQQANNCVLLQWISDANKVAGYIIVWTLHRDGVPRPVHARRSAFCRHSPECFLSPLGVAHSVRLIINVTMSIVSIIRERWVDTDQEHQESF